MNKKVTLCIPDFINELIEEMGDGLYAEGYSKASKQIALPELYDLVASQLLSRYVAIVTMDHFKHLDPELYSECREFLEDNDWLEEDK